MDYQFKSIEAKWQNFWAQNQTYKVETDTTKPKYYVLDMFPYPSGAGLHVGHPLGYIASDIFARYKRLKGFNVLHPMGYDSFGLPAEQYAIQTGQHPAITTEANIKRYREQLDNLGFSFDWSKEVRTSSPDYYKWTQWIFMQLFNAWYNKSTDKAEHISTLIHHLETQGTANLNTVSDDDTQKLLPTDWAAFSEEEKQAELLKYRLTFLKESTVNWCPALGTVLANDEVKDGFSERGGHPVEQKKMMQWSMRITAYAERLLQGLNDIDWPEPLKEMQRNWIGKSVGAMVKFSLERPTSEVGSQDSSDLRLRTSDLIEVFTTRVDTIFGVSFLVLAPEHELVAQITTAAQKAEIEAYIAQTKKKSELDRMADTKTVSGAFTGAYAINPVDGARVPIWIADYVLAGYGTGAVMAVPSGDQRDYLFAQQYNLPIIQILDAQQMENEADPTKEGQYVNSGFINGLNYKEATAKVIAFLEQEGMGYAKINYRMRDAIFGRQRYWGEPVPVYFKNGLPYLIDESELPLMLPEVDKYLPTESGEPPLGRAKDWKYKDEYEYELSTMPGWAGSSWYWYRYMDAKNENAFADKDKIAYWKDVDLYIGGSEHATGHLLYSRFWNKFLKDLGYVTEEEPFKKLINQGMIQGRSNFVYRINNLSTTGFGDKFDDDLFNRNLKRIFISYNQFNLLMQFFKHNDAYLTFTANTISLGFKDIVITESTKFLYDFKDVLFKVAVEGTQTITISKDSFVDLHVDVNIVNNDILDTEKFKASRPEYKDAVFIFEDGTNSLSFGEGRGEAKYICGAEVEKMSKSKFNVVNPDDLTERYGADTLRMYEMFLGPLEQSKPWNTNGIEGVFKFLRKFWKLFHDDAFNFVVSDEAPNKAELKALHKIIKKVEEDIERFSFNTSVSSFMIAVNELTDLKCNKRAILQDLVLLLHPYAPHVTEELWALLGNAEGTISYANFPKFNPEYLVENDFNYPISINGKTRTNLSFPLSMEPADIEKEVLANEAVQKYLEGKSPKKVIIVKGRIVNIVV
ncbi:leucine--tRNA ligase [Pedobacter puniceum]|uniref:Leucine--tRNA ligase n=1 Tax=Pedobacter puniceum TaxID=2666136 RepID=A0A7K0FQL8_9SPHI|nr:class I tRNA ligase family protein [Pedobacter puniceum]MRX48244.1 leucine--tRNA ligase [Pedobacter puniceum]